MSSKKKLLEKIMNPDKTGNVTFEEATKWRSHLHFQFRQTGGSHMVAWHEKIPEIINIQPGPNGKAVASLVMGICSLLVWLLFLTNDFDAFSFLSIPLGIISIVMGAVAKKEIRRTTPGGSTALATAGIVCSIISLALDVVFFVLGLIFVVILGMALARF